jgi:hypothetical protein
MPAPTSPRWRRYAGAALRWGGTAAAVAYIAHKVSLHDAADAITRLSVAAVVLATALVAANTLVGALRWRALLAAYGALRPPPLRRLVLLYFIAFFYNNYLPGAVAGDVVRGVVTRDALGDQGLTAALAIVFVERALGLFALFALLALGLVMVGALDGTTALWWWTALGLAGSVALVLAIPFARRLAPHLPGRLGELAGRLPALTRGAPFVLAILLSIVSQAAVALAGWALLAALAPIGLGDALLVVPLAAATAFLPITVGGAGAREAVFVTLCGQLFHMARADALAASLALWLAHLVVGAIGGLLSLRAGWRAAS